MKNEQLKNLIVGLYKSTYSTLVNSQLSHIPSVYNVEKVEYTNIPELKSVLKMKKCFKISSDTDLKIFSKLKEIKYMKLEDAFTQGLCRYMLCIGEDGTYLPDIYIAMDEQVIYLISNSNISNCVVFIDTPVIKSSSNELYTLRITKDGLFSDVHTLSEKSIYVPSLYSELVYPDSNGSIISKIENKYKLYDCNIILFKDGSLIVDGVEETLTNVFKIKDFDENSEYFSVVFYYKNEDCIDNIVKFYKDIEVLKKLCNSVDIPEYISMIQDRFEFRLDSNISYEENMEAALNYIINYNSDSMLKIFKENNNVITETLKGYEVLRASKNNIYSISRRKNNKNGCNILFYVNGELYSLYDRIEVGITTIKIPTDNILPTDDIIIQYFLDCNNKEFKINLQDIENNIDYLILTQDYKNLDFYSPYFEGRHLYDLPVDEKRQLKVNTYLTPQKDGTVQIELDNPYLYGKDITMVSCRQFRHMKYQMPINYRHGFNCTIKDFNEVELSNKVVTNVDYLSFISSDELINDVFKNNFSVLTDATEFILSIDGYIYIDKDSSYVFNLLADSKCKLYIDEQEVINTSGQKIVSDFNISDNVIKADLQRGYHSIKIIYTKNSIVAKLALSISNTSTYSAFNCENMYSNKPGIHYSTLENTEFKYCANPGQYIIFNEGRKLSSNEYAIKFTGVDQVYDNFYLIINKEIPEGSILDIFYVPDMVQEVYNSRLYPKNGYLTIDRYEMMNTYDPSICATYINGKLINPLYIKNINDDTIKITKNINTLNNVSVIKFNKYDKVLDTLFMTAKDLWTQATKIMPEDVLEEWVGKHDHITDDEQNYQIPYKPDLIWAIIKKFWIERFGLIDCSKLFQYNDDPKVLKYSISSLNIPKYYSEDISYPDTVSYKLYNDISGNTHHSFNNNSEDITYVSLGKFENLDLTKKWSISLSAWFYLDIEDINNQDRVYCELYNSETLESIAYEMLYQNDSNTLIKDIPKCYWIRLHYDNIPLTEQYNCIRITGKMCHTNERIKFSEVVLEESEYATHNEQVLAIDASINTGVELPWNEWFR